MTAQPTHDALAEACAVLGLDPNAERARQRNASEGLGRNAVGHSRDLERILALPQRDWREGIGGRFGTAEQLRVLLSRAFRLHETDNNGKLVELRVLQAVALAEIHDFGGLVGAIRVGGGKTLISLLAAVVVGAERPLLLVPAKLRDKTRRDWERYRTDWRLPALRVGADGEVLGDGSPVLTVESYERLSRNALPERRSKNGRVLSAQTGGEEILAEIRPDLILADEAHRLKNLGASCTRKIRRYLKAHTARYVPLSGTLAVRSLRDYGHQCDWALGEGSPLPHDRGALLEWAGALDEGLETRVQPGALARLCGPDEQADLIADPVGAVRRAFGRRFAHTPGVVVARGGGCDASLLVRAVHHEIRDAELIGAIKKLRADWVLPDGQPLADASLQWAAIRDLACGFYYRWIEQPPDEWREARREWASFCRETLRNNRRGLDGEAQVAAECARSALADDGVWARWRAVKDTFEPRTEAVWITDEVVQHAAKWLETERGIAWVARGALGERLSEVSGAPYFRERARDRTGRHVEDAEGPIVCSINTCGEGVNLQHGWSSSLMVSIPRAGKTWEQVLGREHREGQLADEVRCDVLVSLPEHVETFLAAMADARFISESLGGEPQKLLIADIDVGEPERPGALWR